MITVYDDNDEIVHLKTIKEICPRCNGNGVHDCWEGGMTADEMDEQGPEFLDDYLGGMYNTCCTECNGKSVIDVVDEDRNPKELLELYYQAEQAEHEYQAERRAEMRMGA